MDRSTGPEGTFVLAAFTVAVILGGANFLAVRFSNRELPPLWGAGLRFSLAAVLFVVIALSLRLVWPRGRELVLTVIYGLLAFALFYALMYWALVRVTAGVATVVMAVVPLVTLLLAAGQRLERLSGRAVAGSLLALTGLVWMALGSTEVVLPLTPLLAMLAAAICVGQSVIIGKRVSGNHPAMTNAVALVTGATALLLMSVVAREQWALPRQTEVVWSLVYLVTLGSVGLFVLVLLVVRRWTASATSYMFVLFPVVTMVLGAWLADESVTVHGAIGAAAVCAGVWFGAVSPAARRSATAAPVPAASPIPEPG
ncbi:MAG: DMT family transporter [Acidimicrobiia bacterium]